MLKTNFEDGFGSDKLAVVNEIIFDLVSSSHPTTSNMYPTFAT